MSWWKAQGAKLKDLLELYGGTALVVWITIFAITWFGFWAAITAGVDVGSTAGSVGKVGAAYAATQVTKPVRIAITVILTPIVARLWQRMGGRAAPEVSEVAKPAAATEES